MGLNKGMGSRTYLNIREGKIAKSLGDKKYELFDSIEGYIVGLSTRDGLYGTDLCIDIMDDELYQLQIRIKGEEKPGQPAKQTSYFIAFAHCSPNIDPTKKVTFIPSLKEVDGKKRSALFLKQGSEVIKWAFKRGEGMPDPEEVYNKKGDLISIDWSEVETFRMNKVNEFNTRVQEVAHANKFLGSDKRVTEVETEVVSESEGASEDPDLPF
jgi:hypothetical protein